MALSARRDLKKAIGFPLMTGAPALVEALASLDCRVEENLERHTHAIVIGAVQGVRHRKSGPDRSVDQADEQSIPRGNGENAPGAEVRRQLGEPVTTPTAAFRRLPHVPD
jgi:flavin reductase (DIM6/NTAB) family NADH-FMN oxidoreductase RutF